MAAACVEDVVCITHGEIVGNSLSAAQGLTDSRLLLNIYLFPPSLIKNVENE